MIFFLRLSGVFQRPSANNPHLNPITNRLWQTVTLVAPHWVATNLLSLIVTRNYQTWSWSEQNLSHNRQSGHFIAEYKIIFCLFWICKFTRDECYLKGHMFYWVIGDFPLTFRAFEMLVQKMASQTKCIHQSLLWQQVKIMTARLKDLNAQYFSKLLNKNRLRITLVVLLWKRFAFDASIESLKVYNYLWIES